MSRIQFQMLTNRDVPDPNVELAIWVDVNPEAKTITISDSGMGMTWEEIAQDLGTISHSGAAGFDSWSQQ